jgi:hypothetical protein
MTPQEINENLDAIVAFLQASNNEDIAADLMAVQDAIQDLLKSP